MNRVVFASLTILCLLSVSSITGLIQPVKADGGTIYIRADGSIDPPTAPISTVDNITYTFTGDINDSIVIERDNIVVDGAGYTLQGTNAYQSIGTNVTGRSNVTIENMTIKAFYYGIYLESSLNNSISGNNITANSGDGIDLGYSSGNSTISGNDITNNGGGILLFYSSGNSISGNTFINNGLFVIHSYQNSVENNTVNGRPLVYLEGVSNYTVDDAGQVILVKCDNIVVEGLNLSRTDVGVELLETSNSTISGNNITANKWDGILLYPSSSYNSVSGNNITANHDYGIALDSSSGNSISGNNITANNHYGIALGSSSGNSISENNVTNNGGGISLLYCSNNIIFHNNFINNTIQVESYESADIWDDGSRGNYWSDYLTKYPNATGVDSSGVWNTPYVIDMSNTDHYPFMVQYVIPEFPSIQATMFFMLLALLTVIIYKKKGVKTSQS